MAKSYFDKKLLEDKQEAIKTNDSIPNWLAEAIGIFEKNIELFPAEEDEDRYVVEYIYPL